MARAAALVNARAATDHFRLAPLRILREARCMSLEKLKTVPELAAISAEFAARGRKLVFTNGCFDLLHPGHVRYLAQARALGDALLVALNGDTSVRALKGPTRPINSVSSACATRFKPQMSRPVAGSTASRLNANPQRP